MIDATILLAKRMYYLIMKVVTKNPVKKDMHLAVRGHVDGPYLKLDWRFPATGWKVRLASRFATERCCMRPEAWWTI